MNDAPKKRERGKRGPDKVPRKKRTPVVVDPTKSVVQQAAQLVAPTRKGRNFKPNRKKTVLPTVSLGVRVTEDLYNAVWDLIEKYDTDIYNVGKVALIALVLEWAPEIATKYDLKMPTLVPFTYVPPREVKHPYTGWKPPSETTNQIHDTTHSADASSVLPPAGAIGPSAALVSVGGNGARDLD